MTTKDVIALADKTADAYSHDRYGRTEWRKAIRLLGVRGHGAREIEAILRSKWTRWAADGSDRPEKPRAQDLIRFMDEPRNRCSATSIAELVATTFPEAPTTGDELAGACEGEDIAVLIDLALTTIRAAEMDHGRSVPLKDLSLLARSIVGRIKARA